MNNHIPLPLKAKKTNSSYAKPEADSKWVIEDADGITLAVLVQDLLCLEGGDIASRFVATYNACEGIGTEALEGGVVKEMLEALKDITKRMVHMHPVTEQSSAVIKARDAIAKAMSAG